MCCCLCALFGTSTPANEPGNSSKIKFWHFKAYFAYQLSPLGQFNPDYIVEWTNFYMLWTVGSSCTNYSYHTTSPLLKFIMDSKTQRPWSACLHLTLLQSLYIKQVVRALEGNLPLDDLNEGIIPGHSSFHCRYGSSDDDTIHGSEDLKKFRKMALESHEQGRIECTVPISASDPHTSNSSFEGQQTCKEVEMEKHKENIQNSGESS